MCGSPIGVYTKYYILYTIFEPNKEAKKVNGSPIGVYTKYYILYTIFEPNKEAKKVNGSPIGVYTKYYILYTIFEPNKEAKKVNGSPIGAIGVYTKYYILYTIFEPNKEANKVYGSPTGFESITRSPPLPTKRDSLDLSLLQEYLVRGPKGQISRRILTGQYCIRKYGIYCGIVWYNILQYGKDPTFWF